MPSKNELLKNRRRRTMLFGVRGCGKTSSLVAVTRDYAAHGKVLFLDIGSEQGAVDDIVALPDDVFNNIDYHQPRQYKEIISLLSPGYSLVVVDALQNLRTISAEVTTAALIATGADKDGKDGEGKGILSKLKSIDNIGHPGILPYGRGTSLQKEYERAFFDRLWDLGCDVICACNTKSLTATENYVDTLGNLFDVLIEVDRISLTSNEYEYRFVVDKVRGVNFKDGNSYSFSKGENILNRVDALTKPKPELMMKCSVCNDTRPLGLAKECLKNGHTIAPVT